MSLESLFQPFNHKGLSLSNRIVMAPMTRSFSPEGVPGPDVAEYYRKRAAGGVGLILSEGTAIARPSAKNDPKVPDFHGDAALAGWKTVIDTVHAAGGKMGPQLWHVGSARNRLTDWVAPPPVDSPSGLSSPGKRFTEPMTEEAVADTIAAYAQGARDAERLGFDCAELHGAHGYLIDQFLWSGTNERADAFGGATLKERATFAAQAVKAVRAAVSPDYPILLRLSQWKQQDYDVKLAKTPDEMADWLVPLVEAGVDILHCSQRRFWEPEFPEVDGDEGLNFAGWAKKLTGAPTVTVGSVGLSGEFIAAFGGEGSEPASLDGLLRRLDREEFDLVAVGRALITDPEWANKVRDRRDTELKAFHREALFTLA